MNNIVQDLIKEICNEKGIKYKFISNGWITVLEKNNKVRTIAGYKFDLNKLATSKVFDDKFATYELLKLYNIPVIEHQLFYSKDNLCEYANEKNTFNYLEKIAKKYNSDVVIKTNEGTCGREVYHFTSLSELKCFYNNLNKKSSYSICPFYNIENEYRVVILNNEIRLIYKKTLPIVYGDGKSTIKELLEKYNPSYFKDYSCSNKDVILLKNEEYKYSWKFNLSNGATASFEIDEEVLINIKNVVNKILNNLDIMFCSVDIIKTNDKYYVLEINSGVMMKNLLIENKNLYNQIKLIYSDAVDLMFNL